MIRFIAFVLLVFFSCTAFAQGVEFNNHPTMWKDADVLIWTTDQDPVIDPREFCLSLKRNNTGIGEPKCRLLGEWERDTIAIRYAQWLNANMEPDLKPEYLRARHPSMMAKFQTLEDKIVLFVAKNGNKVNIALFDETASEPKAAGSILLSPDKISMGDAIASTYFSGTAKRRLTKEERKKMQTEPDEYYQEVPEFTGWAGIGLGYSQAHIPLTPYSWYRHKVNSRVKNYRVTKDSVSLWNFIDDSTPVASLYVGGTWYGFIGLELIYRYSYHEVKTDDRDTVYQELSHWGFSQHEIGLSAMLSKNYKTLNWLDIAPFFFLGFQYSFYTEDIALKDHVKEGSYSYESRIKFEEAYKGALFGIGSHFVMFKHYGIGLRTGISSRGREMYSDPSPDAAAEPTIIGGFTADWFISAGLEYHFGR